MKAVGYCMDKLDEAAFINKLYIPSFVSVFHDYEYEEY